MDIDGIIASYGAPGHPAAFSAPARVAKETGTSVSKARNALEHVDSYVLHREYKKPRHYNPYYIYERRKLVQADLIDIQGLAAQNDGVKHLFLLIDVFTRKIWVYPLKDKKGVTVKNALEAWARSVRILPEVFGVDGGKEFWNATVRTFLRSKNVDLQLEHGVSKAAYAERANKSLQILIYKYLTHKESLRYIDTLGDLVRTYNTRTHETIKMSPDDAEKDENQARLLATAVERFKKVRRKQTKYKVGEYVRLKTEPKTLSDGRRAYAEQFHGEYFKIDSVNTKLPIPLYYIRSDDTGELIRGGFYSEELQRVRIKDGRFKIEKVLQSRGRGARKQYKVRWKYYGPRWDSWVPAAQVDRV